MCKMASFRFYSIWARASGRMAIWCTVAISLWHSSVCEYVCVTSDSGPIRFQMESINCATISLGEPSLWGWTAIWPQANHWQNILNSHSHLPAHVGFFPFSLSLSLSQSRFPVNSFWFHTRYHRTEITRLIWIFPKSCVPNFFLQALIVCEIITKMRIY